MDEYQPEPAAARGFSIFVRGPLNRFFERTGLSNSDLHRPQRRILAAIVIAWVPLIILAGISGRLIGGVRLPLVSDVETQVRLLVALPLLIIAEVIGHKRLPSLIHQFRHRGLVKPEDAPRYNEILGSAARLRDSALAEVVILIIALSTTTLAWNHLAVLKVPNWYSDSGQPHPRLTPAGFWSTYVSVPLFRFLLLRWYYRMFIWYRIIWQIARLPLHLNALHPDRAGGLGFMERAPLGFIPFLLAQSVVAAGAVGHRIFVLGAKLTDFKMEIIAVTVLLLLTVYLPLTFFVVHLEKAKRLGLRDYGSAACSYVDEFSKKWMEGRAPKDETFVGNSDIQSLADLGNSYSFVRETRLMPFSRNILLQVATVVTAPVAPLILTMIPFEKIIDGALKLLI